MYKKMNVPLPSNINETKDMLKFIDQNSSTSSFQADVNNIDQTGEGHVLSAEAKHFIRSLIIADGNKRMTIQKLKKLPFFEKIKWDIAEKGLLKMPIVKLKKPKAENFDEI